MTLLTQQAKLLSIRPIKMGITCYLWRNGLIFDGYSTWFEPRFSYSSLSWDAWLQQADEKELVAAVCCLTQ